MKKVLLMLLLPLHALCQQNQVQLIDDFMQAQVKVNDFNGNILVAQGGKVVYQKAFGYRNFSTRAPLDNNSVFEIASVSKQFTAMGILLLKERGKLKLADTLRKFFPQLPYHDITIQNLLAHTSGLSDYMEAMQHQWDHQKIAFNDDMIRFLADQKIPVNFAPGKRFEYSNTGYALLASIIEKVSGLSFKDYLNKNIFEPLDMVHSRVYNTRRSRKDTIANYAYGFVMSDSLKKYVLPDALKEDDMVYYLDGIVGDGTVNSTTVDLLKWDRALKNHKLLNELAQNEMFSPQALMDTVNKIYYGYGVSIGDDQFGAFIAHSGGWLGYRTILRRYVVKDLTIIVLSNNEANVASLSYDISAILFNTPVVFPYRHQQTAIDNQLLNRYIGSYYRQYKELKLNFDIIKRGDKIYRSQKGSADVELKPESGTKFFYGDGTDRQIEFETDKNGNVIKSWFINTGLKVELHKAN